MHEGRVAIGKPFSSIRSNVNMKSQHYIEFDKRINMWKTSNTIYLEIFHCNISMQEAILKILPRDDSASFITTNIFMEQVL